MNLLVLERHRGKNTMTNLFCMLKTAEQSLQAFAVSSRCQTAG